MYIKVSQLIKWKKNYIRTHHNAKLRCCENILRFSCAPITFSFSFSFPSPKNIKIKIKIKMNTVLLCTSYSVMEFKRIWIQCNYCVKKVFKKKKKHDFWSFCWNQKWIFYLSIEIIDLLNQFESKLKPS